MSRLRWWKVLCMACVLSGIVAGPLAAQEGRERVVLHPEAKAAVDGLWSPYCPGMMLEVCTSSLGADLREEIRLLAEDGLSSDSIIELMIIEYGEEYRAEPKASGIGRLAWTMPMVGLGAGLLLAGGYLVRSRRGREPRVAAEEGGLSLEEEARLAEALQELDASEAPDY